MHGRRHTQDEPVAESTVCGGGDPSAGAVFLGDLHRDFISPAALLCLQGASAEAAAVGQACLHRARREARSR